MSAHCVDLDHPPWFPTALAALLVLGILASYLPQHHKILSRRTSEGLSPWWVLLGGLSSIFALANILTLPTSRADISCCTTISGGACAAALLGVAQIGVQWSCFMVIVVLYLVFFPRDEGEAEDLTSSTATLTEGGKRGEGKDQLIVGGSIFIAVLIVALVSVVLVVAFPERTQTWADLLGSVSGVLAAIQYLPQIYYTWVLKDLKSLSLLTLVVQVPGAFVFAFSLWLRVGWEGWSTWLVYIVTGVLQAVLLGMALNYFSLERLRRSERDEHSSDEYDEDDEEDDGDQHNGHARSATERTALLHTDADDSTEWTNQNGTMKRWHVPSD
ncbi:related to PQ loop repeat protein [Ramularia collo-cygni]|uniref:Related to PQ loop repeat protein n=1 Tax=Ramularia collo-cygni TaxID=112498 RepID=A0A2D3VAF6_9PEZI|nr:related to PQ loop repeat protein [Ramularia collo-cygni]CZT25053.1 related to PQ loop repeat protein [Ramularia collo-cygni]